MLHNLKCCAVIALFHPCAHYRAHVHNLEALNMTLEQNAIQQRNFDQFYATLTDQYRALFTTPDYAMAAARYTPEALARKMACGLAAGTANKDGADTMVECWDDAEYASLWDDGATNEQAWHTLRAVASVYADRIADAKNSAF